MIWVSAKEIKDRMNITSQTLQNWRKAGKIDYKRLNARNFLYDLESIPNFVDNTKRKNVIYSRVSNTKQIEDLHRQTRILQDYMASNGVVPDLTFEEIASGMNENRKEFSKLLQHIFKNEVDTVYITYQDRLIRFGFKLIESIFSNFGTKIVVINATKEEDFQQELTADLISIIHHL